MLSILASYAQEESRSVSENCKWRIQKRFEAGEPANWRFMYGYRIHKGIIRMDAEEAAVVRWVFQSYLNGYGTTEIARLLRASQTPCYCGGTWTPKRVLDLLKNEKYAGNALLQKKYVPDHLSKSEKINHGELPKYFSEGTHEAIIAPEIFERVQAQIERNRRKNNIARIAPQHSIFTGRIVCCQCGKRYQRKVTRSEVAWNCATFLRLGKAYCHTKQIPEEILKQETAAVLGLREFDGAVFNERIAEIRVPAFNHLIFVFRDGTQIERVWQDKSRRDSWTEEMRLRAAEHARKRHVKEGGEQ